MKAAAGGGGGGTSGGRSESEKEKTKLRERQRRAITTKIFNGLRKWGGYHLSPRADINEVLRELAKEAGWVVEPDGTTYRAPRLPPIGQCHVCGAATPTASSSVVVGGGGDSSTTASPRHVSLGGEPNPNNTAKKVAGGSSSSQYLTAADIPLAFYLYGSSGCGPPRGPHFTTSSTTTATVTSPPLYGGVPPAVTLATQHQHQFYNLQEVKASNHNTPMSSPLRRLT